MGLKEEVTSSIDAVLAPEWSRRNGTVVPEMEDIVLKNGAVDLDATFLYADMANSTALAHGFKDFAVAKVIRCYLNAATRIIKYYGGEIRSYDGDRVMGIYVGAAKNTNAIMTGLKLNAAVIDVIRPALAAKWSDLTWTMQHGVGIDTGPAMLVRGGVHGTNDIVSIGHAPNIAAKLSELRGGRPIHISKDVYDAIDGTAKYSTSNGITVDMWDSRGSVDLGGTFKQTYSTTYKWTL